jgi:methyl-accepting chemotaxis protein
MPRFHLRWRDLNLQAKFMISVSNSLLLVATILIVFAAFSLRKKALEDAAVNAVIIAQAQAAQIQNNIEFALDAGRTLAHSLKAVKRPTDPISLSRAQVNAMLKQVLEDNPEFLGTYTLWEPNAFDNLDIKYVNTKGHDETGRFIPYWVRGAGGKIDVEPLKDYEDPVKGVWYVLPRSTKQEQVISPYLYFVEGLKAEVLMTSLITPIVVNEHFYGIAGVDLRIDSLQKLIEKVQVFGGAGKVVLIGNDGTIIGATGYADLIGQPVTKLSEAYDSDLDAIQHGKFFTDQHEDNLSVFVPIFFGKAPNPWSVNIIIPNSTITAAADMLVLQMIVIGIVTLLFSIILAYYVAKLLSRPIQGLKQKIVVMGEGDTRVANILGKGAEFDALANGFDMLLAMREERAAAIAKENDDLNESVMRLTDAADQLSKGDLTVKLPVSYDITGNVSDALNVMTRETARVIFEINKVAAQLEQAANAVNEQGNTVVAVAVNERDTQAKVLQQLELSSTAMVEIANLASTTNELAGNASETSKKALNAVRATVKKMEEIRNTVSEAEKTTKRLGERSQEIGFIVEIIKDIAERTHTLALNAGMQAIVAGEAGRGFSVVADEVQRLAETSRESTKQITALVRSLQAESSESMATMNKTIAQVVQVAELADSSGKRMNVTQKTTQKLVAAVGQIAERSKFLEATNITLHEQATELQNSTQATEQAIKNQTEQTSAMIKILHHLVQSVRVFKLPKTV